MGAMLVAAPKSTAPIPERGEDWRTLPPRPDARLDYPWLFTPDRQRIAVEARALCDDLETLRQEIGALESFELPVNLVMTKVLCIGRGLRDYEFQKHEWQKRLEAESPLFVKLATRLSELHVPSALAERAELDERGTALYGLLSDALLEEQMRKKLLALDIGSFEGIVKREVARQGWRIDHMQELVRSEAGSFDGRELFRDMALARGQVLLTSPLIIPDFETITQTKDWPWLVGGSFIVDQKIAGYSFRFGFVEKPVKADRAVDKFDELKRSAWFPCVTIDQRVFGLLQEAADGDDRRAGASATAIFKHLRTLTSLGGHDYVHMMVYPTGGKSWIKSRTSFRGDNMPLVDERAKPEIIDSDLHQGIKTKQSYSGTNIETYSALFHKEIWARAYEAQPEVKTAVLRSATNFIGNVACFKDCLDKKIGAEEAANVAAFLAIIGLSQVQLTMPLAESYMIAPGQKEAFSRLKESVEHLALPAYRPPLAEIFDQLNMSLFSPDFEHKHAFDRRFGFPKDLTAAHHYRFVSTSQNQGPLKGNPLPAPELTRALLGVVWTVGVLTGEDAFDKGPGQASKDRMRDLTRVMKMLPGEESSLSGSELQVFDLLKSCGLAPRTEEWKFAADFVEYKNNHDLLGWLSKQRDAVRSLLGDGAKERVMSEFLSEPGRREARADMEPSLQILGEYLKRCEQGDLAGGWEGMLLRVELEGYRPPWIHRYQPGEGERSQPRIAHDYFEAVNRSGLRELDSFKQALENYAATPLGR